MINDSDADVVNLHWVTNGFLTIEEISKITKPLVWTLYDMWAFCGTEHYGVDSVDARWRQGYTKANRPTNEHGLDLDKDAWQRKQTCWKPMHIVPASSWLTQAAEESALLHTWPITRVPHVIDAAAFSPMPKADARARLGLPVDVPLLLFLASAGIADERKGWALLDKALPAVKDEYPDVRVVIVGPQADFDSTSGVPIEWRGSISGDDALRLHYNACDVTVVPSREDNMPLTAMEAQTCGRPVVAFAIGGLPDIVAHEETGYLAEPFDTASLAAGVTSALNDSLEKDDWGLAARRRALETWSAQVVVPAYLDIYERAMQ